ncbi:hypothetical protein [Clostridium sp.]
MIDTNVIVDFYERILEDLLENKQRKELFNSNVYFAIQLQEKSCNNIFKNFFEIVLGYYNKDDLLNIREMCFPQRFLNIKETLHLDEHRNSILYDIVEKCFYLGFMYHFIFRTFPTRENIDSVDFVKLSNEWFPDILVADLKMKEYSEAFDGLAEKFFKMFYSEQNFKVIIKNDLKVTFLKRGQTHNFFKNIFYCGAMFGMYYDMQTK